MSESPVELSVRMAGPSDTNTIYDLDERALQDDDRRGFLWHELRSGYVWIAERDGSALGYAVASRNFYGYPFIELLKVRRDHRRQGTAGALIAAIEAWVGSGKLFTSTNMSNLPMQRLCERLGFVPSGQIDNLDEGDPELIYFKQLGS